MEAVTLWEANTGASSWQDRWTRGERTPRQSRFAGRTCDPVGDPTLEQFAPEGLHPVGETHIGAVREELSPVRGTPCWNKGTMSGVLPLRRKKRQKQHVIN
ncbi:zinc finger and BTB domain-containing protein 5 [Grus japonensis]|uniref:Zinc finger and BTB domain-containing protein 5 n=1 Tax=Grus japonensis TaxID=30415 RepID=A0ABC9YE57_GRUJA